MTVRVNIIVRMNMESSLFESATNPRNIAAMKVIDAAETNRTKTKNIGLISIMFSLFICGVRCCVFGCADSPNCFSRGE